MNINELDERTRDTLKNITSKVIPQLNSNDIKFLKARRDYLSSEELDRFSEVLESPIPEAEEPKETKEEKASYKELQKKAKEMGLPYVGVSRADLEVAISTVNGPASP